MVNINLMPWREYEKNYQYEIAKKIIMRSFVLVAVMWALFHGLFSYWEVQLHYRIVDLKNELQHTQQQFKQVFANASLQQVNSQAAVTSQKQQEINRAFFSDLSQANMAGVCFMQVSRAAEQTEVSGYAYSAAELSAFLKHWRVANLFNEIQIKTLESETNGNLHFVFQAQQRQRNEKGEV